MIKLSDCPFCGGKAAFITVKTGLIVKCEKCGAQSEKVQNRLINHYRRTDVPSEVRFSETYRKAADCWNGRITK